MEHAIPAIIALPAPRSGLSIALVFVVEIFSASFQQLLPSILGNIHVRHFSVPPLTAFFRASLSLRFPRLLS